MKTDPQDRSLTSISGILLLVVGFGGALFLERPFESQRPDQVEELHRLDEALEDVDARLWEDPLRTIYEHRGRAVHDDERHAASRLVSEVVGVFHLDEPAEARQPDDPVLQVLGVMIPGGPYPEDVERRRRRRMAMLSGLAQGGFVPRWSERLGYFHDVPDSGGTACLVPFEWMDAEGPRPLFSKLPSRVLVLWLDEGSLGPRPLERVSELFRKVLGGHPAEQWEGRVRFGLLGPAGSSTLRWILQEEVKPSEAAAEILRRLSVYSPWATASAELLLDPGPSERPKKPRKVRSKEREDSEATPQGPLARALREKFDVREFSSTVARDDRLAERLLDELERRDVRLDDPDGTTSHNRLVLISEWDTFYGRALPRALENRLQARCAKDCGSDDPKDGRQDRPKQIWRYTYLRGLDGHGPQREAERASEDPHRSNREEEDLSGRRFSKKNLERAVGPAQLDAMRRLATDLKQREEDEGVTVRAIGVLGSDLYDKQLVLQALRPRFPRAVFFATDLDARLLHPTSYRWSRNLVVASSYGLEPPPELQRDDISFAPFRDSYQVSTFVATLRALELEKPEIPPDPLLFEVGRRGAVELCPDEPEGSTAILASLFGLGMGGLVLLTMTPTRAGRRWLLGWPVLERHPERLPSLVILTLSALVFIYLAWVIGLSWEPLYFSQGVSIWPTELMRALALLVCWLLLLRARRQLTGNALRLQEEFGLSDERVPPIPLMKRWRQWWSRWEGLRRARVGGHLPAEPQPLRWRVACFLRVYRWVWPGRWRRQDGNGREVAVDRCWRRYRRLSQWRHRLERIVPMGVGYLLFGILVASRFGQPFVPARGAEAFFADRLVLIVSVLSMIVLTFFVLDETLLCRTLIRHLSGGPSRWPQEAVRKFSRRYRLPEETVPTLIDTHFIADLTAVSGRLVVYPFIVFTLMMVARHSIFDGWDWPLGLILILSVMVTLVAGCAIILRREAEEARRTSLDRLRYSLFQALDEEDGETRDVRDKQLRLAQEEVAQLRRGAFGHWSQHPVLRAVLLPFGSLGLLSLVEALSLLGL